VCFEWISYEEALALINPPHDMVTAPPIFTRDGDTARYSLLEKAQVGMVGVMCPIPVPMAVSIVLVLETNLCLVLCNMHGARWCAFLYSHETITARWPTGLRAVQSSLMPNS